MDVEAGHRGEAELLQRERGADPQPAADLDGTGVRPVEGAEGPDG
ncbi:hypothetical protein [Streptomyces sp. NPDC056683]